MMPPAPDDRVSSDNGTGRRVADGPDLVRPASPRRLAPRDWGLLLLLCLVLFSIPLAVDRTLSTHETVHCQVVREMRTDGDLVVPHYGGRPWLERPPLSYWVAGITAALVGDRSRSYRLASALMAVPCVLLVAWMAADWFGRVVAVMSGIILATMAEFARYAAAPESDIVLCLVVTLAVALFVRLEFVIPAGAPAGVSPMPRGRGWPRLAFFVAFGLANLAKGLAFGDVIILAAAGCYLALCGDRSRFRQFLWLPGWCLAAVLALCWPVTVYLRCPDVLELWQPF